MNLLDGKRLLITGVLTDASLAVGVAKLAQQEGAEIVLSGAGRGLSITKRSAKRLMNGNKPLQVLELDVTKPEQLQECADQIQKQWECLDGILHAIAFAPSECLGGDIMKANWDGVSQALHISAYSLKALVEAFLPLLRAANSASIVGLDFDSQIAWPIYDWMGVAKASLESLARYLARDLGKDRIRVNLVAAGPVKTMAAKGIPGFENLDDIWQARSPLVWDTQTATEAVARACVALFSDLFPATTGEIIHVDGGFHAMGA
jgi:enoyl-[acyl-carrier protein] reductase I